MQKLPLSSSDFSHVPVLAEAVIEGLNLQPGGRYLDVTVGGGGHGGLILAAAPQSQLVAIDQDPVALAAAQSHLAAFGDRVEFVQGNFAEFDPGSVQFDGILADLGVSSPQFDAPERGFSFRHPAPLDMRMDPGQSLTAAELINHLGEKDLADLFYTYGEERFSRRIARRIVAQRPLHTTTELATIVCQSLARQPRQNIHPATRVFQALRIAVNRELEVLETFLAHSPDWLVPGGRLAIISFHSLEDRRVKHTWRSDPRLKVLMKKPIIPGMSEIEHNPRSRSAKLRLAERQSA
ncbi:16S rRNA (cytosine(1402)-N(4))-methyltransferase RsmH [Candidatus Synechococcus calcipolaris G9]|uniref:Ribosomal RNA small subunit methyltransferase H n=1 Tax=Candidatus Synechococcus calcipolaris G9 TaxID=1497997 RepID=A0ABT6EX83_9SYNE|nr:16S rRNA (cytosine(1402)-N(4))-methyltransferase RsmH [Candidatus Synechococcus calcipolaris]MDG2989718.1 16S rRNA (cytosine(1402)-N(4))-methyltransferase RsmH [Candidatus Synechococcus calcipolaris G9]